MNALRGRHLRQRGAALLLAMVILTLVATLAGGMVWQQWRAVEVEAAQRARSQSEWILIGALDWARLILSEDGRNRIQADDLGEPWATPLAESRLSTFLAADQSNNAAAADEGIEAFLSGQMEDAQGRYNLRNLVQNNQIVRTELASLEKLCGFAGLSSQAAQSLATTLRAAWHTGPGAPTDAPVAPQRVDDLRWLGLDEASLERLRPWVTLLPVRGTTVNLNTAAPEVIASVMTGVDLGTAQRMAEARRRKRFESATDVQPLLPAGATIETGRVGWTSSYFFVSGRLRLGDRVVEETTLVRRNNREVMALQRERHSSHLGGR